MTDPIAIRYCIQCPILTQYQTTQMISLDYVSTFELGPFSANKLKEKENFFKISLWSLYILLVQVQDMSEKQPEDEFVI